MDSKLTETPVVETADMRNNRIGVMLQVLNQLMEDCDANNIPWTALCASAEHLWALRNGRRSSYSCGTALLDFKESAKPTTENPLGQ